MGIWAWAIKPKAPPLKTHQEPDTRFALVAAARRSYSAMQLCPESRLQHEDN